MGFSKGWGAPFFVVKDSGASINGAIAASVAFPLGLGKGSIEAGVAVIELLAAIAALLRGRRDRPRGRGS